MTGRTHDLAAVTVLTGYMATQPLFFASPATILVAVGACTIGALTPDIDQPTSDLWHKIPVGSIIGKVISPLAGNHRMISHSLVGYFIASWAVKILLGYMQTFLLTEMTIVWWAFNLGYISHLVMDSLTKEGVPWLFPIPVRMGFPPIEFMRITTGKWMEKAIVFPGLVIANLLLIYANYGKFTDFFSHYITK